MAKNACFELRDAGTAVWLDQLSRELVESGKLAELRDQAALTGVTSNPAIFRKSMTTGTAYDEQLTDLAGTERTTEDVYEALAIRDIQSACDVLAPVYESTRGVDGFVSLEVSPHLARDAEGTYRAARDLHERVGRPNVFIKIPGTPEGVPAIERALADGIPINVTLLFSIDSYEAVAEAYIRALETRAERGHSLDVASVASFFVSRIDTLGDTLLEERAAAESDPKRQEDILSLRGRAAIANARLAYRSYERIFGSERWQKLAGRGAQVQRPLWASTSTKNPTYPDVLYVETLIGPNTVNTMPMETMVAFLDHGKVAPNTVREALDGAEALFQRFEDLGISVESLTQQLLREGIEKFVEPYDALLASLESKRTSLR